MSLKYRTEVDGLRAVAILSVLIYHAEFTFQGNQLLRGGFLGVDIFFVISGYLITSIIIDEYKQKSRLSLQNFYMRRARRLLPALFTVMLVSFPFAWVLLLPTQLVDYSKSVLASVFFGSNFYWHLSLQEYGVGSALLKPFLHTWSLAVEEQYYIVFPIILIFTYKYFRKYTGTIMSIGIFSSLVHAQLTSSYEQSFSFYMLSTRFWELLMGGLLAYYSSENKLEIKNRHIKSIMSILGIVLITYSISYVRYSSNHPGLITLLPVVGTCLVIWFCEPASIIGRILSSKLFVGIGLISYSLYLWHYPLFAFGRIASQAPPGNADKALWIILALIFSIASYRFVEQPFRNKKTITNIFALNSLVITAIVITASSFYIVSNDGLKGRFQNLTAKYGVNEFDNRVLGRQTWQPLKQLAKNHGYDNITLFEKNALSFSASAEVKKVLIVGNSHSRDLFNALYLNQDLFQNMEFSRFGIQIGAPDNVIDELLSSPNFKAADIIIISSRYNKNKTRTGYISDFKALPKFIDILKGKQKQVIVSSTSTEFKNLNKMPVFDWYIQNTSSDKFSVSELESLYFKHRKQATLKKRRHLIESISKHKNVLFLDKDDFMCDTQAKRCDAVTTTGYKLFYDPFGHITLAGAKYFGRRIHYTNWLTVH